MIFWLTCVILSVLVAAFVVAPLLRTTATTQSAPDARVYRAQLDELIRDQERGVITADEAEVARVEIARRLLAADAATPQTVNGSSLPKLAAGILVLVLLTGLAGYNMLGAKGYADLPLQARIDAGDEMRANRPSQQALQDAQPPAPATDVDPAYRDTVAQLRAIVPTRPDDAKGWELLAFHEAQLGNFAAAITAQDQLIKLQGAQTSAEDLRLKVDMMVAAAGGIVSPEAEDIISQILELDPLNIGARYYIGALFYQTDRPDVAFRFWQPLVAEGAADNFHVNAARAQIMQAAFRAGEDDYELPPIAGPTAQDIADAADMDEADRMAMIQGMVGGLSERLATTGGPANDWARLIAAYAVLGDIEAARSVWTEAQEVFGTSPTAMTTLREAATRAGLTQ